MRTDHSHSAFKSSRSSSNWSNIGPGNPSTQFHPNSYQNQQNQQNQQHQQHQQQPEVSQPQKSRSFQETTTDHHNSSSKIPKNMRSQQGVEILHLLFLNSFQIKKGN